MNYYDEDFIPGDLGVSISRTDYDPHTPAKILTVPAGAPTLDWTDRNRFTKELTYNCRQSCIDFSFMTKSLRAARHEFGKASVERFRVLVSQDVLLLEPWSHDRLLRLGFVRDAAYNETALFSFVKRLKTEDEPAAAKLDSEGNKGGGTACM
jgi:hypothetical protein